MEPQSETAINQKNPKLIIGAAILLAVMGILILFALVRPITNASTLLPVLAAPTVPQNQSPSAKPIEVTFTDLNADPLAYLNLPIQVSGNFIKLEPPSCPRFSGPNPKWALVSEDLQLEAKGFERIVQILSPGTNMVVEGIWRLYQGPLGCGKGPKVGSAWYLQVQRIVQPNPLVGDGNSNVIGIEGAAPGLPDLVATIAPTVPLPTLQAQELQTPLATATINQFMPTTEIEATATIDSALAGTPSITPLPTNTPNGIGGTALPTSTPAPGSTSVPGGGDSGATSTPLTPLPPTSTTTSGGGGYPGDPTMTPTTNPYP